MLARRTPLQSRTPLKRGGPLKAKTELRRKTPMGQTAKPKTEPVEAKPSKLPWSPKRSKRGQLRDSRFLAFVRSHGCMVPGCNHHAQAHHWGKHGVSTKASDHEVAPLCQFHHVECWHRHGCLPDWDRAECMARFRAIAESLLLEFRELEGETLAVDFGEDFELLQEI